MAGGSTLGTLLGADGAWCVDCWAYGLSSGGGSRQSVNARRRRHRVGAAPVVQGVVPELVELDVAVPAAIRGREGEKVRLAFNRHSLELSAEVVRDDGSGTAAVRLARLTGLPTADLERDPRRSVARAMGVATETVGRRLEERGGKPVAELLPSGRISEGLDRIAQDVADLMGD
jgi:hypothetical protein